MYNLFSVIWADSSDSVPEDTGEKNFLELPFIKFSLILFGYHLLLMITKNNISHIFKKSGFSVNFVKKNYLKPRIYSDLSALGGERISDNTTAFLNEGMLSSFL